MDQALHIARSVASALQYAHEHDVIHRDIKPENILIHAGEPVVADFGIALAVSAAAGGGRLTETGLSLGTPHYMSPEQASADRELSARSDVYSLACVLYEMLAGQPPHIGPTAQSILVRILTEEPRAITELRPTVPRHVRAVLDKGLEKLPADRFRSAEEFRAALDATLETRNGFGVVKRDATAVTLESGGAARRARAGRTAAPGVESVRAPRFGGRGQRARRRHQLAEGAPGANGGGQVAGAATTRGLAVRDAARITAAERALKGP